MASHCWWLVFVAGCSSPVVLGPRAETRRVAAEVLRSGPTGGEVVRHYTACTGAEVVQGAALAQALRSDGIYAQAASGGFRGQGPLAVRFRAGDAVGDLWGVQDRRGCRHYTMRVKWPGPDGQYAPWTDTFGTLGDAFYEFCTKFFDPDPHFPEPPATYWFACDRPSFYDEINGVVRPANEPDEPAPGP